MKKTILILPMHGLDFPGDDSEFVAMNPMRQEQMCAPAVLVQLDLSPQTPEIVWHSSMSAKRKVKTLNGEMQCTA